MKKFIISALFIIAFGSYVVYAKSSTPPALTLTTLNPSVTAGGTRSPSTSSSAAPPTPVPTSAKPTPTPVATKGRYRNGSFTGTAGDAYYGYVQVVAVVSGGKLADVQFLQYPNDRSTSREINSRALPILRSEAIQVQSANVHGVSGASDSSAAFQESLASALSQAAA